MRTLLRALAVTAAVAALVIGGASSALAASSSGDSASSVRYDFDEAWCFDYGSTYDCTTVDASLVVTLTPDGREIGRIHYRDEITSYAADGTVIGSSRSTALDRTVFADGGQDVSFSVSHTRAVGDFGKCNTTYLFKLVDYELQLDKYVGPGCN